MLNNEVIIIENISKQYRISKRKCYITFREALADSATNAMTKVRSFFKWAGNNEKEKVNLRSSKYNTAYETIWALKNVSIEIQQGEVVGIIGRNGAGKSTLLKVLSRITEPEEGRVTLRGRVGSLLEVGTGFHPELSGHENIYLYGAILGMNRWEITRKFDEIVSFAGVEKFIETPIKRYSSGMHMRLAFSVAAHLETEILLVDEVLAVGDVSFQKKCLGKMEDVASGGKTVLFVSHNMAAVSALCSRCIVLDMGHKIFDGKPSSAIDYYFKQSEARGRVRLSKRTDRGGTGVCRFTNLIFESEDGEPIDVLHAGQPIKIVMEYVAERNANLYSIKVGVHISHLHSTFKCNTRL